MTLLKVQKQKSLRKEPLQKKHSVYPEDLSILYFCGKRPVSVENECQFQFGKFVNFERNN
ncbi:hypothetical protein BIV60_27640 [Bacillus sp. MUM 116]|nr:hypothetical protein BIV60_27640 [Bacillus sp. MUM 116]